MQPEFSQIAPNTTTLYRPFEELFHFTIKFLISEMNLYVRIHFHTFDILHWKRTTFFFKCRVFPTRRIDLMLRSTLFDINWVSHNYNHFTWNTFAFELFSE
jgi:hypothetical protein